MGKTFQNIFLKGKTSSIQNCSCLWKIVYTLINYAYVLYTQKLHLHFVQKMQLRNIKGGQWQLSKGPSLSPLPTVFSSLTVRKGNDFLLPRIYTWIMIIARHFSFADYYMFKKDTSLLYCKVIKRFSDIEITHFPSPSEMAYYFA